MASTVDNKILCERCGKRMTPVNFYTYKDGRKCELCKHCLTAHIDNFDPSTFVWILQKMDVPYLPWQWNTLRDKAFAKDPNKMNGLSVIGKYLAKMKLKQWNMYNYSDTERLQQEYQQKIQKERQFQQQEKERYQAQLKVKLSQGKITLAQYQTLVSTETQKKQLTETVGNVVTGQRYTTPMSDFKNPFQQDNFIPQQQIDPGANLSKDDKLYLALKWGRLYKPSQWVALQQLYNQFMQSFDIQGAARIDTLKMICKTSLKMNQAIDMGDIDSYQKLSRIYDLMMKSAKFTQAQNKDKQGKVFDSASSIVQFVQQHSGEIPKYQYNQPNDIVDKIINDLKQYNKNLVYEDKALAQQIEKYLQDKRISQQMKKNKQQAEDKGDLLEITDDDYIQFQRNQQLMRQQDQKLDQRNLQEQYLERRIKH